MKAWEIYVGRAGDCLRAADACNDEEHKTLVRNADAWLAKAKAAVAQQTAKERPVFLRCII
jgi:hypothetical protein